MTASVAIATMTRARDDNEAAALAPALATLSGRGYAVYVADNGSTPAFLSELRRIPNFEVRSEGTNLVGQVRAAIARAGASASLVIYTEPDKQDFFATGLAELIRAAESDGATAMLVAARDDASLATFPTGQRRMESLFNELAGDFLGLRSDLLYGPLALRPQLLARYIEAVPAGLGWGWRPYVMARAIRAGYRIAAHQRYFACPENQRGEDDEASRLYRLRQMADNVAGLHRGLADGA